jgi:hypothetical protein
MPSLTHGLHVADGKRLDSLLPLTRCGPEAGHVTTVDFANRCVVGRAYGLHPADGKRLDSLFPMTRCGPVQTFQPLRTANLLPELAQQPLLFTAKHKAHGLHLVVDARRESLKAKDKVWTRSKFSLVGPGLAPLFSEFTSRQEY